ncbi:hypothetical protein O181_126829 [Austropuccinia psidii MF-1]|uniref:Uncharacterized protein n=1 Tax=Austropuccinia psidii MF-1 TaxID=1389203 RepID=A0A9Q3KU51_9BASI|nr:hypothetical protein [Austropuccinia psidii MF-1]
MIKDAKALWTKIIKSFAFQTVKNSGRTWVKLECLRFNGNIEKYVKDCSNTQFEISGIGISLPPDIMAYSILGKFSRDKNAYDYVIDSMVLTITSEINAQIVLDQLSELIEYKKTKDSFQKGAKRETSQNSSLLTNSNDFPYKITYLCCKGKHSPKNTTQKPESCGVEHPELQPQSRNRHKKNINKFETHQNGMEALLSNTGPTQINKHTLVIDCGATHHIFHNKNVFT